MTGLSDFVPLAELLSTLTGSRNGATAAAMEVVGGTHTVLFGAHDDLHIAARHELFRTGVISEEGITNVGRAAELLSVCQVLEAQRIPPATPHREPRIVLSAPPGTIDLADAERLDGLILDVIRRAKSSLVIGGPYWNNAGFELLNEVLLPAVNFRKVETTIYLNPLDHPFREVLDSRIAALHNEGTLKVRWFVGPRPTMLHAKFVIGDNEHGYLGTANLTSWGLAGHIEAGVEMMPGQCRRFVSFLAQLEEAGLFADRPSERVPN